MDRCSAVCRNEFCRKKILLKTEMVAGHGGVSGRYKSWRELAFEYAWIIREITNEG